MKKIGVLTSGGDAPGMNACVRAVVRCAIAREIEVVGIRRGYRGLIDGDMIPLGPRSVAHILEHGGTFLESSRCEEMKTRSDSKLIKILVDTIGPDSLAID